MLRVLQLFLLNYEGCSRVLCCGGGLIAGERCLETGCPGDTISPLASAPDAPDCYEVQNELLHNKRYIISRTF